MENNEQIEEKVKLGEEEFTQAELSEMVGMAKSVKEAEEKYNTKLDRVWPEYGRSQTRVKELEQKTAEYEAKLAQVQQAPALNPNDQEQVKQALDAAKKLGLVTKEDFRTYLDQNFREFYVREESAKELLRDSRDLEEEIDGKDGRPAFKTQDILGYMAETGIKNPELAYKTKYESELDSWKESKLAGAKKPGLYTQKSGGAKEPPVIRPNKENLDALIAEQLYGPQE